ncbi:MAG: AarF/ABC1/UbiB kinase family protein [Myxococcales bacterium]|nr:AarF/ABC1/UbiB kinase family protein [Myxococcales bacterium]
MSDDQVKGLLERLRGRTVEVSTSTFGRLRRTAGIALKTGVRALRSDSDAEDLFAKLDPAAIESMVTSLGELKGLAMKMGQILSYVDDSLPAESRALLGSLQRWSFTTPFEAVAAAIREDLAEARAEELLATLEREPVASASVGQVHRARIDGRDVAVKIRHPGIDEAMKADFRAALPGALIGRMIVPGADIGEMIAEAKEGFLSECDYGREAESGRRFAEIFADDPRIIIPEVLFEYSGPRVLTTAWCDGQVLEDYLAGDPPQAERDAIGRALYSFYVGSLYRFGLFNADPHPGNLLFTGDGRVVVLDHGCVRSFDAATIAGLRGLSLAVQADDREAIVAGLVGLGVKPPKSDAAFEATRGMLRGFYEPLLRAGPSRIEARTRFVMSEAFAAKKRLMRMKIPGKLLFLFRIRFGLYAVLATLGAEVDWRALEAELLAG